MTSRTSPTSQAPSITPVRPVPPISPTSPPPRAPLAAPPAPPSASHGSEETLTLYCLAHAGGSAMTYARWKRFVPPWVEVVPLELPGHGTRLREPLTERMDRLTDALADTVRPPEGAPFAVYGHSFGALAAFELTRRLCRRGTPPVTLFVSGHNGPSEPLNRRPVHALPDEAFIAALRGFGGIPDALLKQREVLHMYLPALRADLRMVETYSRPAGAPFDFPIAVYGGRRDVLADPAGLLAWERETTGVCDLTLIPGGHFFLGESEFRFALCARLDRLARTRSERTP